MAILIAILSSTTLSTIITTIIGAIKDNNNWKSKIKKIERDSVRMQLLVLISDYPEEKQEIMNVAEYYFDRLKGNWYMTSLFSKWLKKNGIDNPAWFKGAQE